MVDNSNTDLKTAVAWILRNLHVTTTKLKDEDLDMWEQLLSDDPQKVYALAAYGLRRRQLDLHGHEDIAEDELVEFVKEFLWKLQIAREGSSGVRFPLFEYSVRQIRL